MSLYDFFNYLGFAALIVFNLTRAREHSAPEILSNGDELNYAIREAFGAFRKIPSPKYIFSTNNDRKNIRIDLLVFE